MQYVIMSDWDIDSSSRFEKFKSKVQKLEFDSLVLAGDIASYRHIGDVLKWLNSQGYDFIYIAGNTERSGPKSAEVEGWHIEHGHRFDPYFHLPSSLKYGLPPLRKVANAVRGFIKGIYHSPPKLRYEDTLYSLGATTSKYSSPLRDLFIRAISRHLPDRAMLAHFHMFSGQAYRVGEKLIVFLKEAPGYTSLEDGKVRFNE